jgi:hypothetical protein
MFDIEVLKGGTLMLFNCVGDITYGYQSLDVIGCVCNDRHFPKNMHM